MSNYYGIFDLLNNRITDSDIGDSKLEIAQMMKEVDDVVDITSMDNYEDLKHTYPEQFAKAEQIRALMRAVDKKEMNFNNDYKKSIKKLISIFDLPVHINAYDIHDMNIDIDNIPNLVERFAGGQSFEMSELFESDSMLAFCTAPYPFTFVQLENNDTYQKGIGQIIAESNETNTQRIDALKQVMIGDNYDDDLLNLRGREQEVYVLVQNYHIDDYCEYLHIVDNGRIGVDIKDGIYEALGVEELGQRYETELEDIREDYCSFVQIYDFINIFDGDWYFEEQVICFLDSNGVPTMQKKLSYNAENTGGEVNEVSSNTNFYLTSLEKIFQWWNSDNDLLEVGGVDIRNSWKKKLKKHKQKSNQRKQSKLSYKTLKVRPTLKVVDENGVERTPRLREIAQHTRRGHWAHYGVNGKGLLFGKFAKSVYRKPKTIGKLRNGLVVKDYTLERKDEDE